MDIEIDDQIINELFGDNDKIRNNQNSKLMNNQIFQYEELLKKKSDNNKFYETQEKQNNSMKYLTSCSNFLCYNSDENCKSIYEAKEKIRNNFNIFDDDINFNIGYNNHNEDNEYKNEIKDNKNKIFKVRFKDKLEYRNLCELIEKNDFDKKMKNDEEFRNNIFLNKYFIYNEKSQEIFNKYSYLLPKFISDSIKGKLEINKDNFF